MMTFIIIALIVAFVIGAVKGVKQGVERQMIWCANCNRLIKDRYYNYGVGINVCPDCNEVVKRNV